MGDASWCNFGESNEFGYIGPSRFLLTIRLGAFAVGAIFTLGSSINSVSRLWSSKNSTIGLQNVSNSEIAKDVLIP